jgi:hypothetical protein
VLSLGYGCGTSIADSVRRMVFSVEGGTIEVKRLVFMGSSFRCRRQDVCGGGGFQLRGATERDETAPDDVRRFQLHLAETAAKRKGPATGGASDLS